MAIDAQHPSYKVFIEDWKQMRDTYEGQRIIKGKGTKYLPATPGQLQDNVGVRDSQGEKSYQAYIVRAVFPDAVDEAVEAMIGMMHSKPAKIELPTIMEPMLLDATAENEGLQQFLRRINEQQLVTGRVGIMADLPTEMVTGDILPFLVLYQTETIINWNAGAFNKDQVQMLDLVVLDEESPVLDKTTLEWKDEKKWRVLILDSFMDEAIVNATYMQGTFNEQNKTVAFDPALLITPSHKGTTLEEIPFVFINSKDTVATPDNPPLIGLSNLSLTIYRGEADYRQSLFLQGQDTLITMGPISGTDDDDEPVRVGAGSHIALEQEGDAKYIGVESAGLEEQRKAIENDKAAAAQKSGSLIDTRSREKESGEALHIRVSAQTATLNQIVLAGAGGLQELLRIVATWVGANPDEVIVTPNLDFVDNKLEGRTLVDIMSAKTLGLPLSNESIHKILVARDMTEMTFEEEMVLFDQELAAKAVAGDDDQDTLGVGDD